MARPAVGKDGCPTVARDLDGRGPAAVGLCALDSFQVFRSSVLARVSEASIHQGAMGCGAGRVSSPMRGSRLVGGVSGFWWSVVRGHRWVREGIHPDCVAVVPQNHPA